MNKIILTTLLLSLILGTLSCDDRTSRSYEVVDPEITASQDTATTIDERSSRNQGFKQVNESINGEIIYLYKKDSTGAFTEKLLAFKHKDNVGGFRISIKNDTIELNDPFEGFISFSSALEDFELEYEENGASKKVKREDLTKGFQYNFTPQSKGQFKFAGVLRFKRKGDWEEHPFNYNYIVK